MMRKEGKYVTDMPLVKELGKVGNWGRKKTLQFLKQVPAGYEARFDAEDGQHGELYLYDPKRLRYVSMPLEEWTVGRMEAALINLGFEPGL